MFLFRRNLPLIRPGSYRYAVRNKNFFFLHVWLLILLSIIVTSISVHLVSSQNPVESKLRKQNLDYLVMAALLLKQSKKENPRLRSRLLMLISLMIVAECCFLTLDARNFRITITVFFSDRSWWLWVNRIRLSEEIAPQSRDQWI